MADRRTVKAQGVTPILYVHDFDEADHYYTNKLLFTLAWDWGSRRRSVA